MAFGALRGTLTGNSTSPATGINATGSVSVTAGDLIVVNYGCRASPSVVNFTDNLGNAYQLLQHNPTGSNSTINSAFAYVKANGTLTTVTSAHSTTTGDAAFGVTVIEGPFNPWLVDVEKRTGTADSTTPYACPASGTLSQADEVIVGLQTQGNGGAAASYTATSPYTLGATASSGTGSNTASCCTIFHLVSSTTGETPEVNSSASTSGETRTATFRKAATSVVTGDCIGTFNGVVTTSPVTAKGFATVAVGDVVVFYVTATSAPTAISDNLGNTYSTITNGAGVFRSIVTVAGDLTSLTISDGTALTAVAAAYKGTVTAIDANPATSSGASPWTLPATGTLAQADELVIGFASRSSDAEILLCSSPSLISSRVTAPSGSLSSVAALQHRTVSSTASVTDQVFSATTGAGGSISGGTLTFKLDVTPTLSPSLIASDDAFFAPTITTGPVTVTLSTRLDDADTLYAPTVSLTQTITPNRIDDVDDFASLIITSFLTPALIASDDNFFAPTTSLFVSPGLLTDADNLFAPTIRLFLTPDLINDADNLFAPTMGVSLAVGLFIDNDQFFTPNITTGAVTVSPGRLDDADTLYAPAIAGAGVQSVTPSLITDADTLYAPTVSAGAVTLTPNLTTDSDNHFAPTLTTTATVSMGLLTDTDVFFIPAIVTSEAFILPNPIADTDNFFAPTITEFLTPARIDDTDSFFAPTIKLFLTPNLFTDTDSLFAPTITLFLTPNLITDADSFFAPFVSHVLTPALFTDTDNFFSPTITLFLTPARLDDTDTFFAPNITTGAVTVSPSLLTDGDTIFQPAISQVGGAQSLTPGLLSDPDNILAPTITVGGVTVSPGLLTDSDQFFAPTLTTAATLTPNLLTDTDNFFAPNVAGVGVGFGDSMFLVM